MNKEDTEKLHFSPSCDTARAMWRQHLDDFFDGLHRSMRGDSEVWKEPRHVAWRRWINNHIRGCEVCLRETENQRLRDQRDEARRKLPHNIRINSYLALEDVMLDLKELGDLSTDSVCDAMEHIRRSLSPEELEQLELMREVRPRVPLKARP